MARRAASNLAGRARKVIALAFAWLTVLAALDGFVGVRFPEVETEASFRATRSERPSLAVMVARGADDDHRDFACPDPPALLPAAEPAWPTSPFGALRRPDTARRPVPASPAAYRPTGPPAA